MHVQIFTVYTELMLSVHRADCERATHPTPVEGEVRFFQAQDQPSVTTHIRVGNRVFSHSLDVVSKMHIYTLYGSLSKNGEICVLYDFLASATSTF